jgi:hypothetical protein
MKLSEKAVDCAYNLEDLIRKLTEKDNDILSAPLRPGVLNINNGEEVINTLKSCRHTLLACSVYVKAANRVISDEAIEMGWR